MIEMKKPTVTEVIGIGIGLVGLVGVTFFGDRIINLMGGLTEDQARAKYALVSSQTSPSYRFRRYHGLSLSTCQNAVFDAVSLFDQASEVWPNDDGRYGLMFSVKTSENDTLAANAGCFQFKLSEHPDDAVTLIMVTAVGNLDRDLTSKNVNRISDAIIANIDEDDFLADKMLSPFNYRLSDGSFVIKTTYLGEDIVIDGLEDMIAIGPIDKITLDSAVKGYWCSMEVEGLSDRYSTEIEGVTVPASEEDCYKHFE